MIKRVLISLLAIVVCSCSKPPEFPKVGPLDSAVFETSAHAAVYGLTQAGLLTNQDGYEWGGLVIVTVGGYSITSPVSMGKRDQVTFTVPAQWFQEGRIVAMYHTHPCLDFEYGAVFPLNDQQVAVSRSVDSYIVDMCTGNVHRYIPGPIYDHGVTGSLITNISNNIVAQ